MNALHAAAKVIAWQECEDKLAHERAKVAELVAALEAVEQTWRDWVKVQNGEQPMPTTRFAMQMIQEKARAALTRARQEPAP